MIKDYRPSSNDFHHCPAIGHLFLIPSGTPAYYSYKWSSPRRGCLHTLSKKIMNPETAFLPECIPWAPQTRPRTLPCFMTGPRTSGLAQALRQPRKKELSNVNDPQVLAWITCDSACRPGTGAQFCLESSPTSAKNFRPPPEDDLVSFLFGSTQGNHQLKISIGLPMSEKTHGS